MKILIKILPLLLLVLSTNTYAYTFQTDISSGLDWLNLENTVGLSRAEADIQLTNDLFFFNGWRYATNEEVNDLWFNKFLGADVSISSGPYNGIGFDEATDILWEAGNFLGYTDGTYSGGPFSSTFTDSVLGLTSTMVMKGILIDDGVGDAYYFSSGLSINATAFTPDAHFGHYVVRDSLSQVPVPAAVWLFGSGLIGLLSLTRRNSC